MKSKHSKNFRLPLWLENLFSLVVLISLCSILTGYALISRNNNLLKEQTNRTDPLPETLSHNPFGNMNLQAKAAIVLDATTGTKIYGQNENVQLALASLTKLMTALIASRLVPDYTTITVTETSANQDGKLKPGEHWKLKDLIDYTLIASSNYGADSIASVIGSIQNGGGSNVESGAGNTSAFITAMNAAAAKLGLNQTYFLNDSGLDTDSQTGGAYGSAENVALLLSYILKNNPELVVDTKYPAMIFTSLDNHTIEAKNTNIIVKKIPGLLASKTGYTDLAGGNLAIAFDASAGEPYIVVVLGSTEQGRFDDTMKLVQATIEYLGTRNP